MARNLDDSTRPYGMPPPAFRLPDATHVGVVHLQVRDLERSTKYYQEIIGLKAQAVATDSVLLSARGDDRPLVKLSSQPGVMAARPGAFGLYHFAILVPDRAALGRFAAHLASHNLRKAMADHLVSEALYVWDPDGLGIEVYADRPRDQWQHQGRELAMATDPLDIRTLVAAGGASGWAGMPAGTTIGHVHLHVGDLREAESFYHGALGLEKMVWSYPGALFLAAGGYHHHLGANVWSSGPSAQALDAQLVDWELVVPTADAAADAASSLRAAGYHATQAVDALTTVDPWGTVLRIVSAE